MEEIQSQTIIDRANNSSSLREKAKQVAAEKLWKVIAELGVVGDRDDEVYTKSVRAMEKRDVVGKGP